MLNLDAIRNAQMAQLQTPKNLELHYHHLEKPSIKLYIENLGLEFASLTFDDFCCLLAARNLEETVANFNQSPLGDERFFIGTDNTTTNNDPSYKVDQPIVIPSDDFDIEHMTSLSQLPRLLTLEWQLPEDEFERRFFSNTLRIKQPLISSSELMQESIKDQDSREFTPSENLYRACVLLDTSHSMNNRDARGFVAKGLSIAFIHQSLQIADDTFVLPFKLSIEGHFVCTQESPSSYWIEKVLRQNLSGTTNIQRAISTASELLLDSEHFRHYDILLISDGLSKINELPDPRITLHTFLVGDIFEADVETTSMLAIKDEITKLRIRSATFDHIQQPKHFLSLDEKDVVSLLELAAQLQIALTQKPDKASRKKISDQLSLIDLIFERMIDPKTLDQSIRQKMENTQRCLQDSLSQSNDSESESLEENGSTKELDKELEPDLTIDGIKLFKDRNQKKVYSDISLSEMARVIIRTIKDAFKSIFR